MLEFVKPYIYVVILLSISHSLIDVQSNKGNAQSSNFDVTQLSRPSPSTVVYTVNRTIIISSKTNMFVFDTQITDYHKLITFVF